MGQNRDDFVTQRVAENELASTLVSFSQAAILSNTLGKIFQAIAKTAVIEMGLPDCVVYQASEDGTKLIQIAAHGAKSPEGVEITEPLVLSVGQGVTGRAALLCRSLIIDDTTLFSDHIPDIGSGRSEIAVPIIHNEMVLGVIDCEHPTAGFFNEEHQLALEAVACIASSKVSVLSSGFKRPARENETDSPVVLELDQFRDRSNQR